jgi:hypothetical protein
MNVQQQQALLGLAQMQGTRPPTTPGGRALRFEQPMSEADDVGQLSAVGAAGIAPQGMSDTARMSRWDGMAAAEPAAPAVTPEASKPVLPRVDIATSMAVAADRARTGKSLDELYKARGYDTSGSDDGFVSNLRMRAKQGDGRAWQKLAFLAPGETPEALLTGTRREREGRMLRFAQENARMAAAKEEAANAAAQSARASELDAGRRHQVTLAQMQIDAQTKAAQAQAEYNNKKLAIDQMVAQGQIDGARHAQELAKAQNERNNQLALAQIEVQREGLGLERFKAEKTADQADPMKQLETAAMGESIRFAGEQGIDPMVQFNRFAQAKAGGAPQTAIADNTVPVTKETMEAARQEMLGAADTRSVAEVLAKYLPMMEGRPQFSQQLMAIAKARVPDIETKMQAIAQYGQSNAAQVIEKMENLPWFLAPAKWGTALGRKTSAGFGLTPDVTVADAKRFGNTWNRISQPQPTR